MISHIRKIDQKFVLLVFGNILSILISVFIVKLMTNKFSVAEYGIYSLVMSFATLPQLLIYQPLTAAVFPFNSKSQAENKVEDLEKNVFEFYLGLNFILFFSVCLLAVFNEAFNFLSASQIKYIFLASFFAATLSALSVIDSFMLAKSEIRKYTLFPLINLLIKVLLIVLISLYFKQIDILIFVFSIVHIFIFIFEMLYLKKQSLLLGFFKVKFTNILNFKISDKLNIFNYGQSYAFIGFFTWAQNFFDKWFLAHYGSTENVAIYSVYYQYGFYPFVIISSVVAQYITPKNYNLLNQAKTYHLFLKKLFALSLGVFLISLVIAPLTSYVCAPFLIKSLTNERYLSEIGTFHIIIFAGLAYGLSQILSVTLLNQQAIKSLKIPRLLTAALAVLSYYLLVPKYNILGVISGFTFAQFFYLGCVVYLYLKQYRSFKNQN